MTYRLVITPEQINGQQINLNHKQLHYLRRVLRLSNGNRFIALDGTGNCWLAELNENLASIIGSIGIKTELPVSLSLITALPKGKGYEQVIRCCTELGVNNFLPVFSDRTILKPSPQKVQRWRKIATEAAEQSERQIVPMVLEPQKFTEVISNSVTKPTKYICVARGNPPALGSILNQQNQTDIVIATGCEGGWTELEVAKAIASGFQPVSLGNRILRAITAPIVVSSIVMSLLESN